MMQPNRFVWDAGDVIVAGKVKKTSPRGKTLLPVDPNRLHGLMLQAELEHILPAFLTEIREPIIKSVILACFRVAKTRRDESQIDEAMGLVDFSVLSRLPAKVKKTLAKVYADAGHEAVKISTAGIGTMRADTFDQVNENALRYGEEHSAELVTEITPATRDSIRADVTRVLSGDLPITRLADTLRASYGFSDARASLIARTEFNRANGAGALAGYKANGVRYKIWMTSADEKVSDECAANEDQGPIPVDEPFQSGDMTNPAHPDCRCNVAAHIELGADDTSEE